MVRSKQDWSLVSEDRPTMKLFVRLYVVVMYCGIDCRGIEAMVPRRQQNSYDV